MLINNEYNFSFQNVATHEFIVILNQFWHEAINPVFEPGRR